MSYNKIVLHGKQICDYLYIQSSEIPESSFTEVNSEPSAWGEDTLLFAKFDNDLLAGNSAITDAIDGYDVRRRCGAQTHTEYVTTISQNNKKYIIDYAVKNNTPYTYYLYPTSKDEDKSVVLSPFVSDELKADWDYWSLIVVDETEKENVYYLNKLFKFRLNVSVDDMSNNTDVTVTNNFTKYPTVQYSTANYWSGGLSSLCGLLSCSELEYRETPNMIQELKNLTSDTRKKFLKDISGNLWEVKISAPINISTNTETLEQIKTVKISWVETGDADGVSIINNPNKTTSEWVLTEDGDGKAYLEYVWDDTKVWDNDYLWTGNNAILSTEESNKGRSIWKGDDSND